MKNGIFIFSVFIMVGCASIDQKSAHENYNKNKTFLQTGARAGDKPSFPNSEYDTQVSIWGEFLSLQREGLISSVFNSDGLEECNLSEEIKNKIISGKETSENSEIDLLTQINTEAAKGDSVNTLTFRQDHVYSTMETCSDIATGQPLVDIHVLTRSEVTSPDAAGLKRTILTSVLYKGAFDGDLMPLDNATVLMAANVIPKPGETVEVWELSYYVKKTQIDHVKFMDGTPYAYSPAAPLDGVIKSVYSQKFPDGRVEERTFYGFNLIAVNRFFNDKQHGLQELFLRDTGYKYSCYQNGIKLVIPKLDCEKL
ncbi:hypothetical protein [Marinomonas shanghaiensis]|uniref:hypothetical protein n=1 Tax=Marinomonas shanghaiensis TaxID=2202418 RepID=UPI003A8F9ED0